MSQRSDFARRAHALDDGVFAFGLGAFEELVGDVARAILGAEVVAHEGERVAVHFEAATLTFFGDIGPHRIMYETFLLDEIIDDGAFARTEGACNSYDDHDIVVFVVTVSAGTYVACLLMCRPYRAGINSKL